MEVNLDVPMKQDSACMAAMQGLQEAIKTFPYRDNTGVVSENVSSVKENTSSGNLTNPVYTNNLSDEHLAMANVTSEDSLEVDDAHRVKVLGEDTDYINASFIDGYKKRHEYIAALGPMSKQLGDFRAFWKMVWQQKVEKVVMVTNLVEEGANEERILHHLHFTVWPDKDVPEDVTSIIEFREKILQAPVVLGGPTIVHCVGRTGTYIAIDTVTKEGESEGAVDIAGCVLNMRQNRPNMVQTAVKC
ncbi:receptor-type tyrosine-protein phosphatase epsilon-like [Dreissena polymorpha]|uniref:receptor-type tyrosine-protein phosphatase epsilon-like n=1 Tax=Dreissena polymorpha TaxID=45954 RepID=UPI0022642CF3|nr:receptor-type tyrosine-protein phosphatase epsilon-like [Dreissena polymorpha]